MFSKLSILLLVGWAVSACGEKESAPSSGQFEALIYNVAGLPQGLKDDTFPEDNTPLISPLLNRYDLVLVQEDFAYHDLLIAQVDLPYRSEPKEPERMLNDGLNRFAIYPFGPLARHMWEECNGGLDAGSDCLADKGFSLATHSLAEGVELTVVNLHMDAGGDEVDANVRSTQVDQLLDVLIAQSPGGALIVAGDTNMKPARSPVDEASFARLLETAGLTDACRALDCGDERIDRFLFRSGQSFQFQPTRWAIDGTFVDGAGLDLSDHQALAVDFAWER